jgi:hypothetical protein
VWSVRCGEDAGLAADADLRDAEPAGGFLGGVGGDAARLERDALESRPLSVGSFWRARRASVRSSATRASVSYSAVSVSPICFFHGGDADGVFLGLADAAEGGPVDVAVLDAAEPQHLRGDLRFPGRFAVEDGDAGEGWPGGDEVADAASWLRGRWSCDRRDAVGVDDRVDCGMPKRLPFQPGVAMKTGPSSVARWIARSSRGPRTR